MAAEAVYQQVADKLPAGGRRHVRYSAAAQAREYVELDDPHPERVGFDHDFGVKKPALALQVHGCNSFAREDFRYPINVNRGYGRPKGSEHEVVADRNELADNAIQAETTSYLCQPQRIRRS